MATVVELPGFGTGLKQLAIMIAIPSSTSCGATRFWNGIETHAILDGIEDVSLRGWLGLSDSSRMQYI